MLTSVVRKVLLTLGYPRLDHHLVGQHHVGAMQIRIPDSTACQIFYPCSVQQHGNDRQNKTTTTRKKNNNNNSASSSYFRPKSVQGLIEYIRLGDGILQYLSETPHPCHVDAEPLMTMNGGDDAAANNDLYRQFPLVLFSHGLGGNMELYTELCSHMASLGYCVVALEHEDGSAAYAETPSGTFIPYNRPGDEPYSRQKVLNFRTPMLEQRVREIHAVWAYLVAKKATSTVLPSDVPGREDATTDDNDASSSASRTSTKLLEELLQTVDPSQVHLVGHSFGGATQIMAAQQWSRFASRAKSASTDGAVLPKSLAVLDAWAFSLHDEALDRGMPAMSLNDGNGTPSFPILSVISKGWTTNRETAQLAQFLERCSSPPLPHGGNVGVGNCHNAVFSYYAENSVHQSFSDCEAWLPTWIATRLYNRGRHEQRHETIRSVARAWRKHCTLAIPPAGDGEEGSDKGPSTILQPFSFACRDETVPIKEKPVMVASTASSLSS